MIKHSLLAILLVWGFAIQSMVAQGGSSCSEATEAQQGANVSDNFDGDQWFIYTATVTGEVTVSSVGTTNANTMVEIYDGCDEEPFASSDDFIDEQSEVTFEVIEGLSYLINWKGDRTASEYEWTLAESEVTEGEACGTPIEVTADKLQSSAPTNKYRWFEFTATQSGKVTVSSIGDNTDSCRVAVFEDCSYASTLNNDESWNASKIAFDAEEDSTYLICWQNGSESDSIEWTIEEGEWEKGERCTDPIDIGVSTNNSIDHISATDKWYRYIPTEDGEVTVSSESLTSEDTYLEIYEGCGESPVAYSDDADGLQSEITMNVTGGKAYYIKWDKIFRPETYAWNLSATLSESFDDQSEDNHKRHKRHKGHKTVKVYPNPTQGEVNIDLSEFESNTVKAVIVGVSGAQRAIKQLSGGLVNTIDVSNLTPGVYHILFTDLVSRSVVRLVVE